MRTLSFIAILLFLSSGLFAQTKQTQALTPATTEKNTASPEQAILGRWTLKSLDGLTEIHGNPVEGHIIFGMDHTFKGLLMGAEGNGTYKVTTKDNQLHLEVVEKGVTSIMEIKNLAAKELILMADGAEMVFVK